RRCFLAADDRADDCAARGRRANLERVFFLGRLGGTSDCCGMNTIALVVAARNERIEAHADVGKAFDLSLPLGVSDDAGHTRARVDDGLTVDHDSPGDMRL